MSSMTRMRSSEGMASARTFSRVVLPVPVPPEMRMLSPRLTASFNRTACSSVNIFRLIRSFMTKLREVNRRIVINGYGCTTGGIAAASLLPSGRRKTEISQQPVPLDGIAIEQLIAWRSICPYGLSEDWVFGSERLFGRMPVWPDSLRSKILKPMARKAGITKRIGWHTFRHTYCSLLAETGNDVRVVQELMRHAKISTTMEVYTHARMEKKRIAQSKVVDVLFNRTQPTEVVQ